MNKPVFIVTSLHSLVLSSWTGCYENSEDRNSRTCDEI